MSTRKQDMVAATRHRWIAAGWDGAANGIAAAISVMRVNRVLIRLLDEALTRHGINTARYGLLSLLHFSRRGEMPLSEVSARLEVHQTTITSLVDRVEREGYVERVRHPSDRRSTIARITPEGRSVVEAATIDVNRVFENLPLDEARLEQLVAILTELREAWGLVGVADEEGLTSGSA